MRSKVSKVLLGAVAVSLLAMATAEAVSSAWSDPVRLSETGQNTTTVDDGPSLIDVADDGSAVTVWTVSGESNETWVARRPAGSTAWGAPTLLSNPDNNASNASVVITPGGRAVAVWVERVDGSQVVRSSIAEPGGDWSEAVDLSDPSLESSSPKLVENGAGGVMAVWGVDDGTSSTWVSSELAGSTWSDPVVVPTGESVTNLHLASDGQGGYALQWIAFVGSGQQLQLARYAGGAWSEPQVIAASDDSVDPSSPVAVGDALATAWKEYTGEQFDVLVAISTDGGPWDLSLVVEAVPAADHVSIAADDQGNITVVWIQRFPDDSAEESVWAATSADGQTWTQPVQVSAEGSFDFATVVAASHGSAVAVWSDTSRHAWSADLVDGSWSTPVELSAFTNCTGMPAVSAGANGQVATAFTARYDTETGQIGPLAVEQARFAVAAQVAVPVAATPTSTTSTTVEVRAEDAADYVVANPTFTC